MQFHQDGFVVGDPLIKPAAENAIHGEVDLPDEVDVLIAGTGPAGCLLAAQLSVFPEIKTRILERREGPLQIGQADGISCKSVETFNAFDFAQRIVDEAYWVNETTFWRPDPANRENIIRTGRVQDVADDLSEFPHIIANQARVHDFFLEFAKNSPTRLEPNYGHEIVGVTVADSGSHPVSAQVKCPDGTTREIRARYLIGTDGARSVVRTAIGRELVGKFQNHRWGVMDLLAETNFPDIRLKAAIQSESGHNILLIPREGGFLFRFYVDLGEVDADNREKGRDMPVEQVIDVARHVLHPYTLDVKDVAWFSIYEVGHRVTDGFDDVPAAERGTRNPRVFIAGDACHTHSAKAGQGMNVSMQDTFNLGWKLAAVLQGRSPESLLHTYHGERHQIAHDLINFDSEWSKIMATPAKDPAHPERPGIEPEVLQDYFVRGGQFTAGMATHYKKSLLTGDDQHQHLATGLTVGMRFHSAPVVRLSDAKPMQLGHVSKADGRWRLFAFADANEGSVRAPKLTALINHLYQDPRSPILRYTKSGMSLDSVFDLRAIYQEYHRDFGIEDVPIELRPKVGKLGVRDYEKVFTVDLTAGNNIYQRRGIDAKQGALIVVRPDQYIADVLPLTDFERLAEFFAGFMLEQN